MTEAISIHFETASSLEGIGKIIRLYTFLHVSLSYQETQNTKNYENKGTKIHVYSDAVARHIRSPLM